MTSHKKQLVFHELYKRLVIQEKIIPHEYFLDSLIADELQWCTQYCNYASLNLMRATRHIAFWAAAQKTKKKFKSLEEFMPLVGDETFEGSIEADPIAVQRFKARKERERKQRELENKE